MMLLDMSLPERDQPLDLVWPSPSRPVGVLRFETPAPWHDFIDALGVHPALPQIVTAKFVPAQRLYLLGWIDPGLIKAGELAALIALELALTDRYGGFYNGKLSTPASNAGLGWSRQFQDGFRQCGREFGPARARRRDR
jgi:hypothetical protein